MSGFKPYPAYKDSGVEWLGEVPEHWAQRKLKYIARFSGGGTPSREKLTYWNGDIPWVSPKDMKFEVIVGAEESITSEGLQNSTASLVSPGGLLIVVRSGILKHTIPVAINNVEVALNQDMKALRFNPKLAISDFFFRWIQGFNNQLLHAWLKQGATVESVEQEYLADTTVPMPGINEQRMIVDFLDHETARIDALIEEQQRLIELLKEKRQAVISHAVTKGLDPTVPMKDSGVEWLGEVPGHWEIARVKNVAKLESGHTPSKNFPEYWEGGDISWISLNDSKRLKVVDYIDETTFMITALGVSNSSARLLPARAVVFTRDATIGLAAITTKPMCVSQHLIAWICNENLVIPEYLLLVFYAMEKELDRFTFGATIKTIGMPDIRELVTTVPPMTEQARIVADVNAQRDRIGRLLQESDMALALYLERRSALISAAVTGKIDVRNWQSTSGDGEQ